MKINQQKFDELIQSKISTENHQNYEKLNIKDMIPLARNNQIKFHKKRNYAPDRQSLYQQNLQLKNKIKQLNQTNLRMKTQMKITEKQKFQICNIIEEEAYGMRMQKRSQSGVRRSSNNLITNQNSQGQSVALGNYVSKQKQNLYAKKMLRQYKEQIDKLNNENQRIKKTMKYTRMNELNTENQELIDETIRLKSIVEDLKKYEDQNFNQFIAQIQSLKKKVKDEKQNEKKNSYDLKKKIEEFYDLKEKYKDLEIRKVEQQKRLNRQNKNIKSEIMQLKNKISVTNIKSLQCERKQCTKIKHQKQDFSKKNQKLEKQIKRLSNELQSLKKKFSLLSQNNKADKQKSNSFKRQQNPSPQYQNKKADDQSEKIRKDQKIKREKQIQNQQKEQEQRQKEKVRIKQRQKEMEKQKQQEKRKKQQERKKKEQWDQKNRKQQKSKSRNEQVSRKKQTSKLEQSQQKIQDSMDTEKLLQSSQEMHNLEPKLQKINQKEKKQQQKQEQQKQQQEQADYQFEESEGQYEQLDYDEFAEDKDAYNSKAKQILQTKKQQKIPQVLQEKEKIHNNNKQSINTDKNQDQETLNKNEQQEQDQTKRQLRSIKETLLYKFMAQRYTYNDFCTDLRQSGIPSFTSSQIVNVLKQEPFLLVEGSIGTLLGYIFQTQELTGEEKIKINSFMKKMKKFIGKAAVIDEEVYEKDLSTLVEFIKSKSKKLQAKFGKYEDEEGNISRQVFTQTMNQYKIKGQLYETALAQIVYMSQDINHLNYNEFLSTFSQK